MRFIVVLALVVACTASLISCTMERDQLIGACEREIDTMNILLKVSLSKSQKAEGIDHGLLTQLDMARYTPVIKALTIAKSIISDDKSFAKFQGNGELLIVRLQAIAYRKAQKDADQIIESIKSSGFQYNPYSAMDFSIKLGVALSDEEKYLSSANANVVAEIDRVAAEHGLVA